jgi:hypothetical protein
MMRVIHRKLPHLSQNQCLSRASLVGCVDGTRHWDVLSIVCLVGTVCNY